MVKDKPSIFHGLQEKKVLITGAGTGIGAQIAKRFSIYDAHVGIHYRSNREKAIAIMDEINENFGTAIVLEGDLTSNKTRQQLVRDFISEFGKIDVLVNNAGGIYDYVHISSLSEDAFDKTFDLNVKAPLFLMRDAVLDMQKRKSGKIINISSASVKYGGGIKGLHYAASKAAMESLTTGIAREYAKFNINVNSIRCGVIDTDMHTKIAGYNKKHFEDRVALIPLQRLGKPIDIANMVLFLAAETGDFITGEVFTVAGGD